MQNYPFFIGFINLLFSFLLTFNLLIFFSLYFSLCRNSSTLNSFIFFNEVLTASIRHSWVTPPLPSHSLLSCEQTRPLKLALPPSILRNGIGLFDFSSMRRRSSFASPFLAWRAVGSFLIFLWTYVGVVMVSLRVIFDKRAPLQRGFWSVSLRVFWNTSFPFGVVSMSWVSWCKAKPCDLI